MEGQAGSAFRLSSAPLLSATELVDGIRDGRLSPVAVVEAALQQIGRLDEGINACSVVLREEARREAQQAEDALAEGKTLGALHGVPVAVKDYIWVAGQPATMGTHSLRGFTPHEDAGVVKRLRAAGAIVVAKTTNPDYLLCEYAAGALLGVTRNPWSVNRTAGASSGGSAAALAAGLVPLALGTDSAGSIRVPASFCGVAGLKPTRGLVSSYPGFGLMDTTHVIGPMSRSIRDLELMLDVIAGPDPADYASAPIDPAERTVNPVTDPNVGSPVRVAYSPDLGFANVASEVGEVFDHTIRRLRDAGWCLEPAAPGGGNPNDFAGPIYWGELGIPPRDALDRVQPNVRRLFDKARYLSATDYYTAQTRRVSYARAWQEFFREFDLLLTPTVAVSAFDAGGQGPIEIDGRLNPDRDAWAELSLPPNLTGQPALSVPAGRFSDEMPFGLQIIGPRFADTRCLAAAAAIEAAMPWPVTAPLARNPGLRPNGVNAPTRTGSERI